MIEAGTQRGEGFAVEVAEWAMAVLHNGLGEHAEALAAAERAYEHDGLGFGVWVLPELIEAAARSGDRRGSGDAPSSGWPSGRAPARRNGRAASRRQHAP